MKSFFTKNWIHFAAMAGFIIIAFIYFGPQFDGYGLKQHDIEQFQGMSHEISYYREVTGEEPLWTNSMFGGMPATQISVQHHGNIFKAALYQFNNIFGSPAGIFLLHLICFYILGMFLRLHPLVTIVGALAFAFSSYEIIIMQAGHNSKAFAVAFTPAVLGAFIYTFRTNWKWGAALSTVFMGFELATNHLQVTYYLGFLLLFVGFFYFAKAIKDKDFKKFAFGTIGLIVAYALALLVNYGNISMTNDYAADTIRGGNDVTILPDGSVATANTSGLDKDYITQWSYGVGESFTLVSPYVKGSHSARLGETNFMEIAEASELSPGQLKTVKDLPLYWGEQPITSGPVYLGVVVIFLAFLGLFMLKKKIKWVLFGVAVLALMLSWGKNFMGLTDFFIENVPGYNKFRTVTIILVLVELCVPVIGILLLQQFWDEREKLKEKRNMFLIASGLFMVLLLAVKMIGLGDNYTCATDQMIIDQNRQGILSQLSEMDPNVLKSQYNLDVTNPQQIDEFLKAQMEPIENSVADLHTVRADVFSASMNRSLVVGFFTIGLLALLFFTNLPAPVVVGGLVIVVLADLVPVNQNYLSSEMDDRGNYKYWVPQGEKDYPLSSTQADLEILNAELTEHPELAAKIAEAERKASALANEKGYSGTEKRRIIDAYKFAALNMETNFRVFETNNAWGSSRASYFHKSMGGYHGAKLRSIQNLFEFHISKSNNNVLNMLNVKYFIQGAQVQRNEGALGNAWLVRGIREVSTPNDEILALGKKFEIQNAGAGSLIVNGKTTDKTTVYGGEDLAYLLPTGDSVEVFLSNGISKGLKVFFVMDINRNTNLVPEMTLQADTANSFAKLVGIEVIEDFAPKDEAIMLSSEAKKLKAKKFTQEGSIRMKSYAPNKITYAADVKGTQFVVFSEMYYKKGWTAKVNGKEQEILKVNYGLRGLELPNGTYTIEFSYDDPKYHKGNTMAMAGSVLIFLLLAGMVFMDFRAKRKENPGENQG